MKTCGVLGTFDVLDWTIGAEAKPGVSLAVQWAATSSAQVGPCGGG